MVVCFLLFFFFKQKTAYEMRISDWSSDVCSSDLWSLRDYPCKVSSSGYYVTVFLKHCLHMSPSSHSAPTQNTASPRQTPDPATENQPASGSAWVVFLAFLRLGLTSFGGPVAHFGYFRDEFVTRRNWLSDRNYADLMALCQFMPGPEIGRASRWEGVCQYVTITGVAVSLKKK